MFGNFLLQNQFTGGIFHPENFEEEIAFRQAVTRENMYNPKMEIVPIIRKLDPIDSYQAEKIGKK